MPARRIGAASVAVARYDVLGFDSVAEPTFVAHVAVAAGAGSISSEATTGLRVTHMMPPFHAAGRPFVAQCVGGANLSEDEGHRIQSFIQGLRSEYEAEEQRLRGSGEWNKSARTKFSADQYAIRPHIRRPTADRPYHQFSCAGFVYEAYLEADIVLLDASEMMLPMCNLKSLRTAYPHMAERLDDSALRAEKGLDGNGPWKVLLPGYIMNSLDRMREEILAEPYKPESGAAWFPKSHDESSD